jgi:signal transduction histidine kinase
MRAFTRIQSKLILTFLVVVLLPLLGTGFYGNWVTSRTLERTALDAARHNLQQLAAEMSGTLAGLGNDVLTLSRLESLDALLRARAVGDTRQVEAARARVARDFLAYAQTHPLTYQVRYLDEQGWEVVRVDCPDADCFQRPTGLLQNKAHRYYFTETMQLGAGRLYVSPLDLNREFGRIEVPYRPVIRLATPVFFPDEGSKKQRAGIVILNVLAEPILEAVYRASHGHEQVALANAQGYYLAHPDRTRLWGVPRDLNTGAGLARDYGPLFATFLEQQQGVSYYPPQPRWQEVAAHLLPPGPFIAQQHVVIFRWMAPFGDAGPRWILLSDQPRGALFAAVGTFRWTAIGILGAAALVALGMTVWFARRLTAPILALTEGARRIERGEWEHRIQVTSRDEIGELAEAFNAMAAAQQRSRAQLQALVEQLISAQEEERRMLAYEIHDGLIQRLVAARLHLTNYAAHRPDEEDSELANGLSQLAAAITEARRVIEGLRPALLDDLGLVEALRQYVGEVAAEAGWTVTFQATPEYLRVPDRIEITAFRIVQEALTNTHKYARTDRVLVRLALENGTLSIEVRDWGVGFDPEAVQGERRQVGLTSMRERARLVGGECRIESAPGQGTTVRVRLPVDRGMTGDGGPPTAE